MKKKLSFGLFLLPAILLIFSTSCKKEVSEVLPEAGTTTSETTVMGGVGGRMFESELLKSVRQATSRFNSTTQAIKAGYMPSTHCVGGMGYHWPKGSLVDLVFNPLEPEVLLYATGPDGNLKLVAVEYVVLNRGQPRPMFEGRLFDIMGTPNPTPHWSLHVWLHMENPAGIFTPFNPNVTCP